jgi:hypothetical protein
VAERVREVVHPLEVVDGEQRRLESAKGTVRCLEDADGVERSGLVRVQEQRFEARPVLRDLNQLPDQLRRRGQRNVPLRLVSEHLHRMRETGPATRLDEQPALSATRLADHETCGDSLRGRLRDLGEDRELVSPSDECAHARMKRSSLDL